MAVAATTTRSDKDGVLAIRGISKRFGEQAAVENVSFDVAPGELVALVGASGSGKTTTLRIVAGYETPDTGSVLLNGTDITSLPAQRRGFGMVFQHYALFPHMSVEENVAFGLEARGVNKAERLQRARATLATVGLEGKAQRAIQALSGGEQQRVALARALVIEPSVLLLDEPLSNLDPTLRTSMRDELRALLHRVGVPALLVTHDQEDAFAVSDKIVLLKNGSVLQTGTPEELYNQPTTRDVAAFIGRSSIVPAKLLGMPEMNGEYVVLRPESLEIASEGWPGRISAKRFAGHGYVYTVELESGEKLEVNSSVNAYESDLVHVKLRDGIRPPLVAR